MIEITSLNDSYKQIVSLSFEGKTIKFEFKYQELQKAWFFTINYENFRGGWYMLVNSPNIIRECLNILPFGIQCKVNDGLEPYFLNDFTTDRVTVYVLTKEEVLSIERELYGKIW